MLNPPNGFETWQEYGFMQSKLDYESMLATGCEEGTAIRVLKNNADKIQRRLIIEDHPDMLQGRLQFIQHRLATIMGAIHQAVTSPDFGFTSQPHFPRTASNYEQEGYNFASFVFDREMEINDSLEAVHAYMVHRRELILDELPLMNRKAYSKGYVRFCGELAEQVATHFDSYARGIKNPEAHLEDCLYEVAVGYLSLEK
jgi:hypothetical protein